MPPAVDARYAECLHRFDAVVTDAIRVSQGAAGRNAEPRAWWAALLFTRLCTSSVTLLSLVPESRFAAKRFQHYDCSAGLAIARNVVDTYFTFYYLCVDPNSEDEWRYRLTLLQLHDCASRLAMFKDFNPHDEMLAGFEEQLAELRAKLSTLLPFQALSDKQQRHRMRGDSPMYLSRDQLLGRMDAEVGQFRGLYRLLSAHVHTHPLGFYRMAERDQGRGIESDVEKGYLSLALEVAEWPLRCATQEIIDLYPDIPRARLAPQRESTSTPAQSGAGGGQSPIPSLQRTRPKRRAAELKYR